MVGQNSVEIKRHDYNAALNNFVKIIMTLPKETRDDFVTRKDYQSFIPILDQKVKYHAIPNKRVFIVYDVTEQTAQRIKMLLGDNATALVKAWALNQISE